MDKFYEFCKTCKNSNNTKHKNCQKCFDILHKECADCKKVFIPRNPEHLYCKNCYIKYCAVCSKELVKGATRTCSQECAMKLPPKPQKLQKPKLEKPQKTKVEKPQPREHKNNVPRQQVKTVVKEIVQVPSGFLVTPTHVITILIILLGMALGKIMFW